MSDFTQYLRIGVHSEAEYFRRARPLYDGFVINGNLLAATPSASAALIHTLNKPFFIDPFTHAFALSPKYLITDPKGKTRIPRPKRSFSALADAYFGRREFVGVAALSPAEVDAQDLTERVLGYQDSVLVNAASDEAEFMGSLESLKPQYLIAPYFLNHSNLEWLDINIECARLTKSHAGDRAAVVLSLDQKILFRGTDIDKIVKRYCEFEGSTVLLWLEDFDEDRADQDQLQTYLRIVSQLSAAGIRSLNLFGGFFSCLAQRVGLGGFVHGLVYGENKRFAPVVGGGQPPPRYYMRPAHVSMSVGAADVILENLDLNNYIERVCDCNICRGVFASGDLDAFALKFGALNSQGKFVPDAYALCRYHFLFARRWEIENYVGKSVEEQKHLLSWDYETMANLGADDVVPHLQLWESLL